jgi:hypothetical protein
MISNVCKREKHCYRDIKKGREHRHRGAEILEYALFPTDTGL